MLTATKSAWFERVFRVYNRNLLRRRFHSLRISGIEYLAPAGIPTIVFANHTSWWDGLVCSEVFMASRTDGYVMMEEATLRKYPVFRRLGAFSIDRARPRTALASIEYAAGLLREKPTRTILIFPQGKIVPAGRSDLAFESGILRLIGSVAPCRAVPLALSYEFRGEFKPEIFANAGVPIEFGTGRAPDKNDLGNLEDSLRSSLTSLREDILEDRLDGYADLI